MRSAALRTTLATLTLIPSFLLAGCGEAKDPQADVCHLPGSVVSAAFGDEQVKASATHGEFPVGPHDDNGTVNCRAEVGDQGKFQVSAELVSGEQVDQRAALLRSLPRISAGDLPATYEESSGGFSAQATCGMVITEVTGPIVEGASKEARQALVRRAISLTGCARLPKVPRISPAWGPGAGQPQLLSEVASSLPTTVTDGDLRSPTLCGPDDKDLLGGLEKKDAAAFTRGKERLVVTVHEPDAPLDYALSALTRKASSPTCTKGQSNPPTRRWQVRPVSGVGDAAYEWTVTDKGTTTSGIRAYEKAGDLLVSATITRPGTTRPPADSVAQLLTAQKANLS